MVNQVKSEAPPQPCMTIYDDIPLIAVIAAHILLIVITRIRFLINLYIFRLCETECVVEGAP